METIEERFVAMSVGLAKEGAAVASTVVCFLLGTVFPLVMVGWLIIHH